MAMSAALQNYMVFVDRRARRQGHRELSRDEEEEDGRGGSPSPAPTAPPAADATRDVPTGSATDDGEGTASAAAPESTTSAADDDSSATTTETTTGSGPEDRGRAYLRHQTLIALEEEREIHRRRSSTCTLVAVFVLFRVWVEALAEGDPGWLMLSLLGTSWTARWVRYNREREEELDERIDAYVRNHGRDGEGAGTGTAAEAADRDSDLRLMSFQAQLALAILESQRNMMAGGFGHPDGHGRGNESHGVSEATRGGWDRYEYEGAAGVKQAPEKKGKRRKGGYGSVSPSDDDDGERDGQLHDIEEGNASPVPDDETATACKLGKDDETKPSCSICLCEYELGDRLVRLPCGHVYHDECVGAWTSDHVRCPLCNFDLESLSNGNDDGDNNPISDVARAMNRQAIQDSVV